jgi:hypothetical protein
MKNPMKTLGMALLAAGVLVHSGEASAKGPKGIIKDDEAKVGIVVGVAPIKELACSSKPVFLVIKNAVAGEKPADAEIEEGTLLDYTSIVFKGQKNQITASVEMDKEMPKNLALTVSAKAPSGTGDVGASTNEQKLAWNGNAKTIIKDIKSGWVKGVGVNYKLSMNGAANAVISRGTITYTLTSQN